MNYFKDHSLSIGHTPLVQIQTIIDPRQTMVLAKIESRNPLESVKARPGAAMIWAAEAEGKLKKNNEIIEPTSGNTGIALAFVAASRGYKISLVMPDTMSVERRKILQALGANLILTDGKLGMTGAVKKAEEIFQSDPNHYFMPQQFKNPANPKIHKETTGPEIWKDTDGQIDVLISGVGTGGTITGVSRFIKNTCQKKIISVAVEPKNSPVLSQKLAGMPLAPATHKIQGIGAGFVPAVLDMNIVDRVEQVEDNEAFAWTKRLAKEEGIFAGISSGAAMAVAAKLSQEPEMKGKTFVVILPDSGERYLSMDF